MQLLNERNQIRDFIGNFRTFVNNPSWGTAIWNKETQVRLLGEIEKLDGEKATSEDIANILGRNHYISPQHCGECGDTSWDIVMMGGANADVTMNVCLECLQQAMSLARNAKS